MRLLLKRRRGVCTMFKALALWCHVFDYPLIDYDYSMLDSVCIVGGKDSWLLLMYRYLWRKIFCLLSARHTHTHMHVNTEISSHLIVLSTLTASLTVQWLSMCRTVTVNIVQM